MSGIASIIRSLRRDSRNVIVPSHLSALLVIVGVIWLLLLPLDRNSRHTYISENALLPAQVHTYFGGSEEHIYNAFAFEIKAIAESQFFNDPGYIAGHLCDILESAGLDCAVQSYVYQVAAETYQGENVYAVLRAPRGDATEAIVLAAAWFNLEGKSNHNGVALVLTLARYFQRWSLWSKDIVILITPDSKAGPQAWVDAYHDEQVLDSVALLSIKSGALQGVVVIENVLDHKFESLHIVYDGINGQLPNLDLFNTVVVISEQMGIKVNLQQMWPNQDSYSTRLLTMLKGMASQATGYTSGVHSSFVPYHVDSLTLQAVGEGGHDMMEFGRLVESTFRSINNLLESFHQSFFLYLLMKSDRFVSIGTYLPSAMLIAASFSIMAIALWIFSGTTPPPRCCVKTDTKSEGLKELNNDNKSDMSLEKSTCRNTTLLDSGEPQPRLLFIPALVVAFTHLLGLLPLWLLNNFTNLSAARSFYAMILLLDVIGPSFASKFLRRVEINAQPILIQCFSLLVLGIFLAALATLNFSLSFFVGLLLVPISLMKPPSNLSKQQPGPQPVKGSPSKIWSQFAQLLFLQLLSPPAILWLINLVRQESLSQMLMKGAFAWTVNGVWTQAVIWCVWWPAWFLHATILSFEWT